MPVSILNERLETASAAGPHWGAPLGRQCAPPSLTKQPCMHGCRLVTNHPLSHPPRHGAGPSQIPGTSSNLPGPKVGGTPEP